MASKVYFVNLRSRSDKDNKITKIRRLFEKAGFNNIIKQGDLTAVKLHFGERGNDTFINPVFVRQVVDKIKEAGGKPFLTDTNTLYSGSRHNSVDHIITAIEHGYDYAVIGAPIIIADGLKSRSTKEVEINKKHFEKVKLAEDMVSADAMLVLSHFKGHEMAGFGGTIKNLAMGGASVAGKKEQHALKMAVDMDKCIGCGQCVRVCPEEAINIENRKAVVSHDKCIGCGECRTVCKPKAIGTDWSTEMNPFIERLTEYAFGVAKSHEDKIGYINFLINITPDCDCVPWSDAPIVPDIGFLASTDPVALDKACYDLVNKQSANVHSMLNCDCKSGEDKFNALRSETRGSHQLSYGEEIGMGSCDYELIEI